MGWIPLELGSDSIDVVGRISREAYYMEYGDEEGAREAKIEVWPVRIQIKASSEQEKYYSGRWDAIATPATS